MSAATAPTREYTVTLRRPHQYQRAFIDSPCPRKVIRAGRRSGKTTGIAIYAVQRFLAGKRVLYATPTEDQIQAFWFEVKRALYEPIEAGVYVKNETMHSIELRGTKQRIRAKTAYNSDTLRGDSADELIFDEWQLMNEGAWSEVGAPMLLDNNGNAVFIYTPPSLHSRSVSKADDPRHAAKLYKRAQEDTTGRWETFHFKSMDNPHISRAALAEIAQDMTAASYRMEIEAEDIDEAPGALWKREDIEKARVLRAPDLARVVVAIDPSATSTGDEAGIVVAGSIGQEAYVLDDLSLQASPDGWARQAVTAYHRYKADRIVAESNNGGEMIEQVIRQIDASVRVKLVHASRGKATRAEPVAAVYEQGRAHHVGTFPRLEDECCLWTPGDNSPNRMDALVWALTELVVNAKRTGQVL